MDIGIGAIIIFSFLAGVFYQGYKGQPPNMWMVFLLFIVAFIIFLAEGSINIHFYKIAASRQIYSEIAANYTCFPNNQTELAIQTFCKTPAFNMSVVG